MSLTAFFSNDLLSASYIADSTPAGAATPVSNACDPRPRKVFQGNAGGCFEVSTGRQWIDLSETAPPVTVAVAIPVGIYTGPGLAGAIKNAINATAGLASTYHVEWVGGRFRFTAYNSFSLLWASGVHGSAGTDDNIGNLLGFRDLDVGPGNALAGQDYRYATHTFIRWRTAKPTTANLAACHLYGDGGTSFANANIYINSSNLGNRREVWAASASTALSFSTRPDESENVIQIAWPSAGVSLTHVFFSWEHIDESEAHQVGLVSLLRKTGSTTQAEGSSASRTVTQLQGHGILDDSAGLSVDNYYPARALKRWATPLSFDAWELADYRAVIHKLVRNGRQRPFVWALNWTDIYAGTRDPDDEANNGSLFWGALQDYSLDDRGGATSAYLSGTITIEQVR